ncbi:ERG4/ERG24 ergosterol biosynthesis protein [Hesseltinella vesiculosa]|uniref:ERG4/ERG24 ergosterol biosynthesis protein n=1 Tax=Hesseltinella vesiculosa TaxID=101127 RepID=A0A1X2G8J7_9FUNG|nr:ERG4/ERG24 ergosterol biosynthesis protein [Hesseltinella vesiculosa]
MGAMAWYAAYILNLLCLSLNLPGDNVKGTRLRDGSRLTYSLNGLSVFQTVVTLGILVIKNQGLKIPLWVVDHDAQLAIAALMFSWGVSLTAYYLSFDENKLLSTDGNTDCPLYDFTVGRELNPRIGNFDVKLFSVLRPGLIGWFILNGCYLFKQYDSLGYVTNSMVLIVSFQALYILDAFWHEEAFLHSLSITHDGFGFLLAFGSYCWMPYMYSLQARYLCDFPLSIPFWHAALVALLASTGFYIYRAVEHLSGPDGQHLLLSGWWGKSRHMNYFGDLLMAFSWCLACGFESHVPYFYCVYLLVMLVYRERRDDRRCSIKYGSTWTRYCVAVPYRIVPFVY